MPTPDKQKIAEAVNSIGLAHVNDRDVEHLTIRTRDLLVLLDLATSYLDGSIFASEEEIIDILCQELWLLDMLVERYDKDNTLHRLRNIAKTLSLRIPKQEELYPCSDCGKLRTKDEGGTTFTVCDECWEKTHKQKQEGVSVQDIEDIGIEVVYYLGQMYPQIWKNVPETAKISLKNFLNEKIEAIIAKNKGGER